MPDDQERSLPTLMLDLLEQQGEMMRDFATLKANDAILLEDRGRAADGRAKIYDKLEEVSARLIKVETLPARVDEIERNHRALDQRVDTLESVRDHALGAAWALRAMWMVIGGAILTAFAWLGKKLGL